VTIRKVQAVLTSLVYCSCLMSNNKEGASCVDEPGVLLMSDGALGMQESAWMSTFDSQALRIFGTLEDTSNNCHGPKSQITSLQDSKSSGLLSCLS
jgi:hypothetical protein